MITARPPCSCTTRVLERKEQPLEEVMMRPKKRQGPSYSLPDHHPGRVQVNHEDYFFIEAHK